jgi:magnesium-transporting ATPase (P-type)
MTTSTPDVSVPSGVRRSELAEAHALTTVEVLAAAASARSGLSAEEAERRVEEHGANVLPEPALPGALVVFVRQFLSPFIYVLLFAAGLSVYLREWSDAAFIAGVLLLNATVGSVQEYRAQRSAAALRRWVRTRTRVLRDGDACEIDAEAVTLGDVVLLASGDKVPADLRLLDAHALQVDESLLTGESTPAAKFPDQVHPAATGLADRRNLAYAGTLVTYGRGTGVVVAIAAQTQVGRLAGELVEPQEADPPLLTRMRQFTVAVAAVMAVVAGVLATIEVSRGTPVHEVALLAVALAVSAVPEGLPVAMTVALAIGMNRMARRNVVVRRLLAVESLGSCTLIASDKTGTLTVNELTVGRIVIPGEPAWAVSGVGAQPDGELVMPGGEDADRLALAERLAVAVALCNEAVLAREDDAWVHHGDAVDVALLVLARKLGVSRPQALQAQPLVAAIPFESERRDAATRHRGEAADTIVVKGAVEQVLPLCGRAASLAGPQQPLDPTAVRLDAEHLAADGHRVIAVATGTVPSAVSPDELPEAWLRDLTLLGLVGMIDPPRPGTAAAIADCHRAGIDVRVVTGDHPETAYAIARTVGVATDRDQVVTGDELQAVLAQGPDAFDARVAAGRVYARVEPAQKLAIVESLIRQGHLVAVTGDGANDAPALRQAHVGVAMGRSGTDVAREAADLVLTDDDFASIAAGVEEGRVAYANVRKVIQLLVATGAGELVLFLLALGFGLPIPLLAVQLLWLNLVTNGIQDVALAFEPGEGDEMRRPPRSPGERIFDRLMIERVLLIAVVIGGVAFLAFRALLDAGWGTPQARNAVMLLMVLFENAMVFEVRSETRSTFGISPFRNWLLVGGTALAFVVHLVAMHLPFTQSLLDLAPLSLTQWLSLLGLAILLLVAVEVHKLTWSLRHRRATR